jgi:hypothetical protein
MPPTGPGRPILPSEGLVGHLANEKIQILKNRKTVLFFVFDTKNAVFAIFHEPRCATP